VCQVLAQSRCGWCDTPVCAPHADSYWRGDGGRSPLEDAAERKLWEWATSEPAALIWGTERGANEPACTVCRAVHAEQALSRFRLTGAHATEFDRQVAAFSCGVFCNLMPPAPTPRIITEPILDHLRRRSWPVEPVATVVDWQRTRSGVTFRTVEADRGYLVPGVPIQGRASDPSAIMILESRCVWMLLGLGVIESQPIEGGRMFFHPPILAGLERTNDKRGRLTLAMLLGVSEAQIDADLPSPERFVGFWQKMVVSLAGSSPLEYHATPDAPARLAAADVVMGVVHPRFPPQL
jgi:hypothetical protein